MLSICQDKLPSQVKSIISIACGQKMFIFILRFASGFLGPFQQTKSWILQAALILFIFLDFRIYNDGLWYLLKSSSSGYHFLPIGNAFGRVQSRLKRTFIF
jgi:hypothetical protein